MIFVPLLLQVKVWDMKGSVDFQPCPQNVPKDDILLGCGFLGQFFAIGMESLFSLHCTGATAAESNLGSH